MITKKTPHHSTLPRKKAKKQNRIASLYPDLLVIRDHPTPEIVLQRLAEEYIDWADRDDSLILGDFRLSKKISRTHFHNLVTNHETMRLAHEYARDKIASRRESGGVTRKFDSGFILKSMPLYSDDYKKLEEWRSNLAKNDKDLGGTKIVVIERMPESADVIRKVEELVED